MTEQPTLSSLRDLSGDNGGSPCPRVIDALNALLTPSSKPWLARMACKQLGIPGKTVARELLFNSVFLGRCISCLQCFNFNFSWKSIKPLPGTLRSYSTGMGWARFQRCTPGLAEYITGNSGYNWLQLEYVPWIPWLICNPWWILGFNLRIQQRIPWIQLGHDSMVDNRCTLKYHWDTRLRSVVRMDLLEKNSCVFCVFSSR